MRTFRNATSRANSGPNTFEVIKHIKKSGEVTYRVWDMSYGNCIVASFGHITPEAAIHSTPPDCTVMGWGTGTISTLSEYA
jgi:hypothetical protein